MRIKRFNENSEFEVSISSERVDEIIFDIEKIISNTNKYSKIVETLINEFSNFVSNSKKGNNQIDDSIAELQLVRSSLDDIMNKMDTIIDNLNDYRDDGEKFIYKETN